MLLRRRQLLLPKRKLPLQLPQHKLLPRLPRRKQLLQKRLTGQRHSLVCKQQLLLVLPAMAAAVERLHLLVGQLQLQRRGTAQWLQLFMR